MGCTTRCPVHRIDGTFFFFLCRFSGFIQYTIRDETFENKKEKKGLNCRNREK